MIPTALSIPRKICWYKKPKRKEENENEKNDEVHQMRNEMKNLRKKRFILITSGRRIVLLRRTFSHNSCVFLPLKFRDFVENLFQRSLKIQWVKMKIDRQIWNNKSTQQLWWQNSSKCFYKRKEKPNTKITHFSFATTFPSLFLRYIVIYFTWWWKTKQISFPSSLFLFFFLDCDYQHML